VRVCTGGRGCDDDGSGPRWGTASVHSSSAMAVLRRVLLLIPAMMDSTVF
jgi:hypothetical protein